MHGRGAWEEEEKEKEEGGGALGREGGGIKYIRYCICLSFYPLHPLSVICLSFRPTYHVSIAYL